MKIAERVDFLQQAFHPEAEVAVLADGLTGLFTDTRGRVATVPMRKVEAQILNWTRKCAERIDALEHSSSRSRAVFNT